MRPILATISSSALQHNFSIVKQYANNAKVMAVVKANAYGHGLIDVAHALHEADAFATLNVSEAIDLREAGIDKPILLLEGPFGEDELRIAASFDISIVVHQQVQIKLLAKASLARPVNIYLKMNTGMNRLGFKSNDFEAAFNQLGSMDNVGHITLMSHFATADEDIGIAEPLKRFKAATNTLSAPQSLANSATILRYPEAHADWVRPGIMLYGASPVGGTSATGFGLQPVMQLTSEIIAVQTIESGESVGYGNTFTATKKTRVGIVACGYADGYPRHAPSGTPIAISGQLTKTLGRVSMDMLYCDLSLLPDADVGSSVELWGKIVSVDTVAEASGTVGYELLCAVALRVPKKVMA